jgi:hypothetical protein
VTAHEVLRVADLPDHPGIRYTLSRDRGELWVSVARVWPLNPGEASMTLSRTLRTAARPEVERVAGELAEGLPALVPFGAVVYSTEDDLGGAYV